MTLNEKQTPNPSKLSEQAISLKKAIEKNAESETGSSKSIQEVAGSIEGQGVIAVDNTYQWMVENRITVPPSESMSISDPDRYKAEMDSYLQRSADDIVESGFAIACADNAQVMVDILRAKDEQAQCVDTLSETFIKTGDQQGHMFIEISTENGSQPFNPVNGNWETWQVDADGNQYIHWQQTIDMGEGPIEINEKYYRFLDGESPQSIGYTDVGSMQDIAEKGRNQQKFDRIRQ